MQVSRYIDALLLRLFRVCKSFVASPLSSLWSSQESDDDKRYVFGCSLRVSYVYWRILRL